MPAVRAPAEASLGVAEALENGQPPCAGCGAKVGPAVLKAATAGLEGPGDDAAILKTGNATQVITTDHLRAFTEDPWRFARIAASTRLATSGPWVPRHRPRLSISRCRRCPNHCRPARSRGDGWARCSPQPGRGADRGRAHDAGRRILHRPDADRALQRRTAQTLRRQTRRCTHSHQTHRLWHDSFG